jgi:predicted nucleic acid-binding Zn finger protein
MAETEEITVADVSAGPGNDGQPGAPVSLPVVELLTGRGFITGKSGSGKSNSASVIAEKLLDSGFGLFIVDIDGEYYGLKEEYEILHVGADEECDIQVGEDHAEKLASLALEQNVPIILDVSSFLDESEAEAVLTSVARHLFAKAKKQKQPFLLLVEEVHEYIPEGGSVGECGKMLIKIGKRGRKHGLGVVGISQRPADVKKDFITQCDWLLWHRLTWDNDTSVVRRVLDGEYATAVEDLDDGEGFLVTDWSESVRRVQFHRKQTFDAGATPGLEDVERPDLKSVSGDLVAELEQISEEEQARETRIEELREELDRKNSRIAELEAELQDARDLSRMADQFVDALLDQVDGAAPGRTEQERMRERRAHRGEDSGSGSGTADGATVEAGADDGSGDPFGDGETGDAFAAAMESVTESADAGSASADTSAARSPGEETANGAAGPPTNGEAVAETAGGEAARTFTAEAILQTLSDPVKEMAGGDGPDSWSTADGDGRPEATDRGNAGGADSGEEPLLVRELKAEVGGLDTRTREMLAYYAESGPGKPVDAHRAAGGDGDRTHAYAHNRRLRTRGLVEHVGRGTYDCRLRDLLREELEGVTGDKVEAYARDVEETVLE